LHEKASNEFLIVTILYYMPVPNSCVCDHAAPLRMSVNADLSTALKCLASGKKSIEQLCPSVPWQTSALELLLFCNFRILLYITVHYGMLILPRAHEACLTPSEQWGTWEQGWDSISVNMFICWRSILLCQMSLAHGNPCIQTNI